MKNIIKKFMALEKKDRVIFFLVCSTIINFLMGTIKLVLSFAIPSFWFFVNAGFSLVLASSRYLTIKKYNKIKALKDSKVAIKEEYK